MNRNQSLLVFAIANTVFFALSGMQPKDMTRQQRGDLRKKLLQGNPGSQLQYLRMKEEATDKSGPYFRELEKAFRVGRLKVSREVLKSHPEVIKRLNFSSSESDSE